MKQKRKEILFLMSQFDLELNSVFANSKKKIFSPPLDLNQVKLKLK